LDVSVLDRNRRPVRGLTVADFTVLEDGKPRRVVGFTAVDLPAMPAASARPVWANEIHPDVATNRAGEHEGRLVIIFMDRSIHREQPTVTARKIATAIVEGLGPNDLAALVTSGAGDPQTLTGDRARLIKSINQRDWATDSDKNPWTLQSELGEADASGAVFVDGRCLCGLCRLEAITRVSDAVRATARRRKVLFFIGSGLVIQDGMVTQTNIRGPAGDLNCASRLKDARAKLFASLALSNLTVHSLDPDGLKNIGGHTRASTPNGKAPASIAQEVRRAELNAEFVETLRTHNSLRILPDETGGRAVMDTNAPDEKVPEIYRESEAYYLLGFETAPSGAAGNRRSIEVKVKARGLQVRAQRLHELRTPATGAASAAPVASPGPGSAADALSGLLPGAARPLAMATVAFAMPDGPRAIVRSSVDVAAFLRGATAPVALDVTMIATDQTGREVASATQRSTVAMPPESSGVPAEAAVKAQIEMEPGDYEVRVAVADPATGAVASVFSPVLIPKFAEEHLSLSDVTVEIMPPAGSGRAAATTTRRAFSRRDAVRALLQIYQGTTRTDDVRAVRMRVRILDARGQAVRDQALVFNEQQFALRRADCVVSLPLADLPRGEYLLRLDASMADRDAARALRFAVE
jgi:VWFA-related protein